MADIVLSSSELSYQYPQGVLLTFPDIVITRNQHSLLLGDSGKGKTTLLHLLGGFSEPTKGIVKLMGTDLHSFSGSSLDAYRAKHLGFIFQEAHLLKNLTVAQNIKLAQHLAKRPVDEQAISAVLDQLQLADKAEALPNQLSRGQKQRVAIARAIINRPALLLADEPTASLDDTNTEKVLKLLLEAATTHGSTLLIATHDKRIKDHFAQAYQL
ncbi:ABC transporter ATP-binding protein [Sphingobacterium griseoflavum]|uniref:Peptide ABC transporter ATP-binding protein n=1 Tax=Sphingobacterium griseoflavum TaxID=1474952 RepID=A0ABQ3HRH8_9SPHI|nr:ATP-binding cassette domain-containing protein [Sphingobacterium griseoflavum]GHE23449.1 peptide ABC transporter ATP-binding protein [Sphingobacterium griseoflavum]